jgi:hypothetical protein
MAWEVKNGLRWLWNVLTIDFDGLLSKQGREAEGEKGMLFNNDNY